MLRKESVSQTQDASGRNGARVAAIPVAEGVWNLGAQDFNLYALEDGGRVIVLDTGLRGDWGRLVQGLAELGHTPQNVAALLITHAHRDHIGEAEWLRRISQAAVHLHGDDAPFAAAGGGGRLCGRRPRRGRLGLRPRALHAARADGAQQHGRTHDPARAPL